MKGGQNELQKKKIIDKCMYVGPTTVMICKILFDCLCNSQIEQTYSRRNNNN